MPYDKSVVRGLATLLVRHYRQQMIQLLNNYPYQPLPLPLWTRAKKELLATMLPNLKAAVFASAVREGVIKGVF